MSDAPYVVETAAEDIITIIVGDSTTVAMDLALSDKVSSASPIFTGVPIVTYDPADISGAGPYPPPMGTAPNALTTRYYVDSQISPLNSLKSTIITTTGEELNKLAGTPAGLTSTEIGYLDGVTSGIQGQLDGKVNIDSPALTGTPSVPNIKITGTDSADVNTLDYFEEGSFTLTVSSGLTETTLTGLAYYQRVGRLVTIALPRIVGTNNSTTTLIFDGLPISIRPTSNAGATNAWARVDTAYTLARVKIGNDGKILIYASTSSSADPEGLTNWIANTTPKGIEQCVIHYWKL